MDSYVLLIYYSMVGHAVNGRVRFTAFLQFHVFSNRINSLVSRTYDLR